MRRVPSRTVTALRLEGMRPQTYLPPCAPALSPAQGLRAVSESEALFSVLRQSADPGCVAAIEQTVREAPDRDLCRVNVLDFAAKHGLNEELALAAFLHASRLGLFELSWNVLCPGCGGVLDAGSTLKTIDHA